jgi:hypothetical protein
MTDSESSALRGIVESWPPADPAGADAGAGVDIGVRGLRVRPGSHICALYTGSAERDSVLLPFLRSALLSLDKLICVLDSDDPVDVLDAIGGGVDARGCAASRQLDLLRARDTYLRSGRFRSVDMVGFWKAAIAGVMNTAAYPCVRAIGEMSWSLSDLPAVGEVVDFELELNRLLPLYPQVIVCMYDLARFGTTHLVDTIKMHPYVLLGGLLVENPYFLSAQEMVAAARSW